MVSPAKFIHVFRRTKICLQQCNLNQQSSTQQLQNSTISTNRLHAADEWPKTNICIVVTKNNAPFSCCWMELATVTMAEIMGQEQGESSGWATARC